MDTCSVNRFTKSTYTTV